MRNQPTLSEQEANKRLSHIYDLALNAAERKTYYVVYDFETGAYALVREMDACRHRMLTRSEVRQWMRVAEKFGIELKESDQTPA